MAVTADRAVFWYGCNMTRHGELIRTSARLLEAVGVEAAPAGGPSPLLRRAQGGQAAVAGGMAERTMAAFNATGAPDVITWCPSCHINMHETMAPVTAAAFATGHITEALHRRRDRLRPLLTRAVPAGPSSTCTRASTAGCR